MCEHSEITDAGVCTSCSVDVTSQEFVDSLPEAPENLRYLGDLLGLIQLAQVTAQEYMRRSTETKPQFRLVGAQLVRTSPDSIWVDVLQPSFPVAKALGYRGDCERWAEICKEYAGFTGKP